MHEDLIHELVLAARQMERFLDEYEFIVDVTQEEALLKIWEGVAEASYTQEIPASHSPDTGIIIDSCRKVEP